MRLPNAVPKPRKRVKGRKPLRAHTRLKARNAKRKGHKFPKLVIPEYREWIRAQPCLLANCWYYSGRQRTFASNNVVVAHVCGPTIICAHVKSRGSGGRDKANCVPLCYGAHDSQWLLGIPAFEKRWGVDLKAEAARLWAAYSGGSVARRASPKEQP